MLNDIGCLYILLQGLFGAFAQPMKDDVAMQRRLSLAEPIPSMITVLVM